MNFKLYRDAFKFIIVLTLIGVFGLIYAVCVYIKHKVSICNVIMEFHPSEPEQVRYVEHHTAHTASALIVQVSKLSKSKKG